MLAVAVIVIPAFALIMTLTDRDSEPEQLTADCAQVDTALRIAVPARVQTVAAMPGTSRDPAESARSAAAEAKVADDIRAVAATIESPALRADVDEIADDFDAFSQSRRGAADLNALPDKEFMGALDGMMTTVGELVKACPGVGDPAVSGQ